MLTVGELRELLAARSQLDAVFRFLTADTAGTPDTAAPAVTTDTAARAGTSGTSTSGTTSASDLTTLRDGVNREVARQAFVKRDGLQLPSAVFATRAADQRRALLAVKRSA